MGKAAPTSMELGLRVPGGLLCPLEGSACLGASEGLGQGPTAGRRWRGPRPSLCLQGPGPSVLQQDPLLSSECGEPLLRMSRAELPGQEK